MCRARRRAVTVHGELQTMASAPSTRVSPAPSWFDSLLFLMLLSGPPNVRDRDPYASLDGELDLAALIQIGVWLCGGLWTLARVYPAVIRRGVVPPINPTQVIGALFVAALALSLWDSPGFYLTAFTLGQFAVMLGFVWVFAHRFGTSVCLRHLFIGVSVLALMTVAALFLAPQLVADGSGFETRVRGSNIADTGSVAVIGLVLCLSGIPRLRGAMFWGAFSLFGVLLAASRTRSAYLAFLVFVVIGVIHGRGLRVRALVVPLVALALSVFVLDVASSTTDYLVRDAESIESMSDRIPLWRYLTEAVMRDAPITGLGYSAASRVLATQYNPGLGNAHSAFFEVLVGGGVLGASLYLLLCGSFVGYAVRLLRVASGRPSAVAAVGLLVVALLMGVASEGALRAGPLGFAFWSLTALLPELWREGARSRTAVRQPLDPGVPIRLRNA
jgi:O-antigen ligase